LREDQQACNRQASKLRHYQSYGQRRCSWASTWTVKTRCLPERIETGKSFSLLA
jgi:hypothetical protein